MQFSDSCWYEYSKQYSYNYCFVCAPWELGHCLPCKHDTIVLEDWVSACNDEKVEHVHPNVDGVEHWTVVRLLNAGINHIHDAYWRSNDDIYHHGDCDDPDDHQFSALKCFSHAWTLLLVNCLCSWMICVTQSWLYSGRSANLKIFSQMPILSS